VTPGGVGETIISRHSIAGLVFSGGGGRAGEAGEGEGEDAFGWGGGAEADWKL